MEIPNDLTEVLAGERQARLIEESIYSVLPHHSEFLLWTPNRSK